MIPQTIAELPNCRTEDQSLDHGLARMNADLEIRKGPSLLTVASCWFFNSALRQFGNPVLHSWCYEAPGTLIDHYALPHVRRLQQQRRQREVHHDRLAAWPGAATGGRAPRLQPALPAVPFVVHQGEPEIVFP